MRFCENLTDTGRKINELEDLKDAFDKLVAPFNSTLRALEQEKSQNMSLSGMLYGSSHVRTKRCAPSSTRSKENRRSSRLEAKDCAKISNLREKLVAHWKAPASN